MIKINNEEVKVTLSEKDNSKTYEFFACSCDEKDKKYYRDLLEKEFPKEEEDKDRLIMTFLVYSLSGEDWEINNIYADQWMGISLSHIDSKDNMFIQCDFVEYGLIAALKIAESLNKSKEENKD